MAKENYTTYTEVDPNSHIEKTANHIDFDAYENEDAYVYKDKGVGHFGSNWEHLVDIKDNHIDNAVAGGVWAVSNDLDDFYGLETTGKTALVIFMYDHTTSGTRRIYLREIYNSTSYNDYFAPFTFDATYYLRIKKIGTALTCEIYGSAADRTNKENVIDILSLTLHGNWSFQYIFGAISYNVSDPAHTDVDVDNLDLQEVSGEEHYKIITDYIGGLDTRTRIINHYRIYIDYLSGLDSVTKIRNYIRSFTDNIGTLDTKIISAVHHFSKVITEIVGVVDSKIIQLTHHLIKLITEIIGVKDSIVHTWVRPPVEWIRDITEYLGEKDKQYRLWNWFRRLFKYKDKEHPRQHITRT